MMGRPGQNAFAASGDQYLRINGGYISIQAFGDGLDINGGITMNGGTVIISGPTGNMNGSLDYYAGVKMTGGLLIAAGSSGMAMAPDATSTRYSVMMTFPTMQAAKTMVHIEASDGTQAGRDVLTFVPTAAYQTVVLASPELRPGTTYVVYSGGNSTGTAIDGVYSGGSYTGGTQAATFTVSGVVTRAGSAAGGVGGPGGRR